jgi:hypothetical protein
MLPNAIARPIDRPGAYLRYMCKSALLMATVMNATMLLSLHLLLGAETAASIYSSELPPPRICYCTLLLLSSRKQQQAKLGEDWWRVGIYVRPYAPASSDKEYLIPTIY